MSIPKQWRSTNLFSVTLKGWLNGQPFLLCINWLTIIENHETEISFRNCLLQAFYLQPLQPSVLSRNWFTGMKWTNCNWCRVWKKYRRIAQCYDQFIPALKVKNKQNRKCQLSFCGYWTGAAVKPGMAKIVSERFYHRFWDKGTTRNNGSSYAQGVTSKDFVLPHHARPLCKRWPLPMIKFPVCVTSR